VSAKKTTTDRKTKAPAQDDARGVEESREGEGSDQYCAGAHFGAIVARTQGEILRGRAARDRQRQPRLPPVEDPVGGGGPRARRAAAEARQLGTAAMLSLRMDIHTVPLVDAASAKRRMRSRMAFVWRVRHRELQALSEHEVAARSGTELS
jgi:hypothetical protein